MLGKRLEIYEPEAAILVVSLPVPDGVGVTTIVARLNADGPRRYSYHAVRTWLENPRYIGRVIWNQRRFERRPGTRAKVGRRLPESQWKVYDRPELRIIDETTWTRVQARAQAVRAQIRPTGLMRGKHCGAPLPPLFSGFLGAAFVVGR